MGSSQIAAFFSPGTDCQEEILKHIELAQDTLDICVFTISDDQITRAIFDAFDRGVAIRLITDNEKLLDKGSDIVDLSKSGIEIRVDQSPNHMHHKFMVKDAETVLTGSYNWTRSAALYNHENIITIYDDSLADTYLDAFDALWEECIPFTQHD